MKLEYMILGLLEISPQTGYSIKKYLDTEGRFISARRPLSQIYTTLKKMAENKWVMFDEEHREGKPDLKMYHNTEIGRQVFMDYLHSPMLKSFRYRESDIYYRVMFSFLVKPEVILNHLKNELDFRKAQIAQFRIRDRSILSTHLSPAQLDEVNTTYEMLHTFGARAIDDYVDSLEEMVRFFKTRKNINN